MKTLIAVLVGLTIALSSQVAAAYVMQIVTTAPLAAEVRDGDSSGLGDVVEAAIRDVLDHAIAFTPTVVRIEDARIVGDRLYLVLLIADADGESALERLDAESASPSTEPTSPPAEPATL